MTESEQLVFDIYAKFNARDIDGILLFLDPNVDWPNGWEGGRVQGHEEVRDYWTRQWNEVNPTVDPVEVTTDSDDQVVVTVRQVVKATDGALLSDGIVKHSYLVENGMIKSMTIIPA